MRTKNIPTLQRPKVPRCTMLAAAHRRSKRGFFVFSQARVRPLTYREPIRFAPATGKRLRSTPEGVKHAEVPLILVVEGGHILRRIRELARVNARVHGAP